jgi:membrane fusion protein (multidrug efflux system)
MSQERKETVNHRRKKIAILLFSFIVITAVIGLYAYVSYKNTHISTDDAFIDGRIHTISSKVPGTVLNVSVRDNEFVTEGTLLVGLDEKDYTIRVNRATAALDAERSKLTELETKIDVSKKQLSELVFMVTSAEANLKLREAELQQSDRDFKRISLLYAKKIATEEQFEKTKTLNHIAALRRDAAHEQVKQLKATMETQHAVIRQAVSAYDSQKSKVRQQEEALEAETLQKSYTRIYAPVDGYITRKNVETGNQIEAGQPLMAVVPLDDIWITANYKETQLESVRPGQKVDIHIDTYPGVRFTGTVHSIMAGTGSIFSLFPPENATGNYVKVVQRIPVKIVLDKPPTTDYPLRIGMSVVPTIVIEQ